MERRFIMHTTLDKSILSAQKLLKQYFGYDSFRTGQEELISHILEGKDSLRYYAHRSW